MRGYTYVSNALAEDADADSAARLPWRFEAAVTITECNEQSVTN